MTISRKSGELFASFLRSNFGFEFLVLSLSGGVLLLHGKEPLLQ
jgi:hypothetical protein